MNKPKMIEEIRKAIETGEVSQRAIDSSDCRATGKILRSESVHDCTVLKLYNNLLKIRKKRGKQIDKPGKEALDKTDPSIDKNLDKLYLNRQNLDKPSTPENSDLTRRVAELEKAIIELREENSRLRAEIEGMKERKTVEGKDKIQGFSLTQRRCGGKEAYWYAGRRVEGKQVWIYIGKDKGKAEEKIWEWCYGKTREAGH